MNFEEAIENRDRLYKEYLIAERERLAEELMKGMGKMLGMPSVPLWLTMKDYLKEPYRVFADQILKLKGEG